MGERILLASKLEELLVLKIKMLTLNAAMTVRINNINLKEKLGTSSCLLDMFIFE